MIRNRLTRFRHGSPSLSIVRSLRCTPIRNNSAASALAQTATTPPYSPPPPLPNPSSDESIKYHFDSTFSPQSNSTSGLFLYPPLTSPQSLPRLAKRTLIHGQHIVDRICRAPSDPTGQELRLVVKNLDRLSDVLCGVIDMCELIRSVHPEQAWVDESEEAYGNLCSFMNELNTHTGLYKALKATLQHDHSRPLSPPEIQVAMTFIRDFEKSGIHLPPAVRSRFVGLSDSILSVGRTFLNSAMTPPQVPIRIPDAERLLSGMGARFIRSLDQGPRGSVYVQPESWEAQMIGRYAREGEARRLVFIGSRRTDPERVNVLETMLKQRSELATILGKSTWAEVALSDKMAKAPENVMGFLTSLANHHRPSAAADVATLQRIKSTLLTGTPHPSSTFYAWDRDYYTEKYIMSLSPTSSLPPITPYFSVGTCLLGLSRLFETLYGISFKPAPIARGEAWHESVRRLDVVDESGPIGVIYCDLFSRDGKPPSAAHYTVRCSRRVDDDDMAGDGLPLGWDTAYGPGIESPGQTVVNGNGRYQLPIVVLTTDFGSVENGKPALLGWNDVETLFHEMGHAIHSMIGRTEWHNVSGTRCATDFVELPSILMEHFVSSPDVLSLFAKHYQTLEPLPLPLLKAHLNLQQSLSALETHGQILMALLDQKYHMLTKDEIPTFDSTQIHTDLQNEIGVLPPVEGTSWQTQFGHLYGYGATYYSYLFDRAIAGKVWSTLFNPHHGRHGSLSREGGEIFRDRVLKWGGGKDPWEMVGDVVGGKEGEIISRGDKKAMDLVGGWLTK